MGRKREHTNEQIVAVLKEIDAQTDRGAAIVAAAVLEEILEITLQGRMVELNRKHYDVFFGLNGPAGNFSSKIELLFALGLCSESHYGLLHQIREIRNKFAHRIDSLDFDNELIAPLIDKLGPTTLKSDSRRQRFSSMIGVLMLLMYAASNADIRIKDIGDTNPRIYLELLKRMIPESADDFEQVFLDSGL
jgi:DNA-binding MltR family transcriptional regulator